MYLNLFYALFLSSLANLSVFTMESDPIESTYTTEAVYTDDYVYFDNVDVSSKDEVVYLPESDINLKEEEDDSESSRRTKEIFQRVDLNAASSSYVQDAPLAANNLQLSLDYKIRRRDICKILGATDSVIIFVIHGTSVSDFRKEAGPYNPNYYDPNTQMYRTFMNVSIFCLPSKKFGRRQEGEGL